MSPTSQISLSQNPRHRSLESLGVEVEESRTKIMGSVSLKIGDGTARFSRATLWSSAVNILMLFSVLTTNLFALYAFTSAPKDHQNHLLHNTHKNISLSLSHTRWKRRFLAMKASIFQDPTLQKSSNFFSNTFSQELGSLKWWLLWAIPVSNLWICCYGSYASTGLE